jgi:RNA polymerase sigma-70 factor, ECF subfamily
LQVSFNDDGFDQKQLIEAARNGSKEALGSLLEMCRGYLLLIANQEVGVDLQSKAGPSDLVQETFQNADRDFKGFRGRTKEELLAWLSVILRNNVANFRRKYRETDKRQVNREVSLTDTPRGQFANGLADSGETPSEELIGRERDEALERAIEKLPEDYRRVIRWQKDDGCSYDEIGQRLGRSADAARKLFSRAVEQLAEIMESPHDSI